MINVLHRGYQVLRQLNSFMKFIPVIFLAIDILSGLGISYYTTILKNLSFLIQRSKPYRYL